MASTIYNNQTGQIYIVIATDDVPDTETTSSIPGFYTPGAFYVDVSTKQPVQIPSPPQDGQAYTWNNITKTWDLVPTT